MKGVLEFIGLFVVMLLANALFFGDFIVTDTRATKGSDQDIKTKIEVITLAESSTDPTVKAQAEISKQELKDLQQARAAEELEKVAAAKKAAADKKLEDATRAEIKASLFFKIVNFLGIAVFIITMIGAVMVFMRQSNKGF